MALVHLNAQTRSRRSPGISPLLHFPTEVARSTEDDGIEAPVAYDLAVRVRTPGAREEDAGR